MPLRLLIPLALILAGCGYRPGTPLSKAAFEGRTAEVIQILESGYRDPDDVQAAMVAAARSGHANAIPVLVKYGASLEHRSGVNGWTPLQHAVHKAQLATVTALVELGADPDAGLFMAAGYGQADIVAALLDRGGDPARVYNGRNALDVALTGVRDIDAWTAGSCQADTVRELLKANRSLEPLQAKPPTSCPEIVSLIDVRINVTANRR